MKLTENEYNKTFNNVKIKKNEKYKNKKTVIGNYVFDSKKESNYYLKLKMMNDLGLIKDLKLQEKFELQPKYKNAEGKNIRSINYIADFTYYDLDGKLHVIDTKGYRTEVYKLKKKLFEFKYNLIIEEV